MFMKSYSGRLCIFVMFISFFLENKLARGATCYLILLV